MCYFGVLHLAQYEVSRNPQNSQLWIPFWCSETVSQFQSRKGRTLFECIHFSLLESVLSTGTHLLSHYDNPTH